MKVLPHEKWLIQKLHDLKLLIQCLLVKLI